jgi:FkbM family methyltransferase
MKLTSVECILCENAFGRYCVPKSSRHRPASQEVLGGRVWERETIEFMRRHVLDRDVIHAGMFFGDFLPGLAPALAPGRKVFAFEPNPESFACAQWTAALNALTNVDMRNAGLGEAKRSALLRTQENGRAIGGASHILPGDRNYESIQRDVISVSVVTIDEILPPVADVGIIQLDIEGYEKYALLGSVNTIRKDRPIIILEDVPQDVIDEFLIPIGYRRGDTINGNTIFVPGN